MVGVIGFEPTAPWSQTKCATGLRYTPMNDKIYILLALFGRNFEIGGNGFPGNVFFVKLFMEKPF